MALLRSVKGPIDFCLVVRSLNRGGTQRQLTILAEGLKHRGFRVVVVTFYPDTALGSDLAAAHVPVVNVGKRGRWDILGFFWRLVRVLRSANPRVIYSFLGTPNLVCLAARPFLRRAVLVWGMRGSERDTTSYDWVSRLSRQAQSPLARFVDVVILNSEAGLRHYSGKGFPASKLAVVPNGIDSESFYPDREAGLRLRSTWGIGSDECVFGLVGNFELVKGHGLFLDAAALVASNDPNTRFVCVGGGPGEGRIQALRRRVDRLRIEDRVVFTGECADMRSAYNAIDILVSASESEGFPNVVGEAMACGVSCMVTDVGDSAAIVGDAGVLVASRTAEALAQAMKSLAADPEQRVQLGERARRRIADNYPPDLLVTRTLAAIDRSGGLGPSPREGPRPDRGTSLGAKHP